MIREDVIYLIPGEGPERMVYCTVRSVGMSEKYKAMEYGLSPTIVFVLSDFIEYQDEQTIRWGQKYYSVIRTYIAERGSGRNYLSGREIEITVQELKAMYAPHTVTVYNVREDPLSFETSVYITVLPGVYLEGSGGATDAKGGMRPTGKATLRVPMTVGARDGLSGTARSWASPRAYAQAEARAGLWTLDPNRDFFVKGEVVIKDGDFQTIRAAHDECYRVTSLEIVDTGAKALWHIEAGGA